MVRHSSRGNRDSSSKQQYNNSTARYSSSTFFYKMINIYVSCEFD